MNPIEIGLLIAWGNMPQQDRDNGVFVLIGIGLFLALVVGVIALVAALTGA